MTDPFRQCRLIRYDGSACRLNSLLQVRYFQRGLIRDTRWSGAIVGLTGEQHTGASF